MAVRVHVKLRSRLDARIADLDEVTKAREDAAARIAADAERRSRVTRARGTFRAEVDRSSSPPRVAAVAGNQRDKSFIVTLEELGGEGFRPPPAPLRTSAERYGRVTR